MAVYRNLSNAERLEAAEGFFYLYSILNPSGAFYLAALLYKMHLPFCCKENHSEDLG